MIKKALLIFMKFPEAGRVKTRLARELGQAGALSIYQKLLRRTLGVSADFRAENPDVDLYLFCHPPARLRQVRKKFPGNWFYAPQGGGHIGLKMLGAFRHVFSRGYRHAVLIGTDTADIEVSDLKEAFRSLEGGKIALGPARDGGYYLIGLHKLIEEIFHLEKWSVPDVLQETLKRLGNHGEKVGLLRERTDIDEKDDG